TLFRSRRRQNLSIHPYAPAHRALGGVKGNDVALARTDDHKAITEGRGAGEQRLGARVPQRMAGRDRKRGDVAFTSRGIHTLSVACERKPQTQRNLLAANVSTPDVLDAQAGLQVSELCGRVDVLVLRTRAE